MRFTFLKTTLSLTLLLISTIASANPGIVKGQVVDAEGEPEIFATLRLYADNDSLHPVLTECTDTEGNYNLAGLADGSYKLVISSVGKTTGIVSFDINDTNSEIELDTIVMQSDENLLKEVVVEVSKPLVTVSTDRIVYDIAGDPDARTAMLTTILTKVPLLSIDADGTIKVNGSGDFKIYKNGRPNATFSNNAKEIFKSLPASMIQRIEVITDPGAREDAEDNVAILNIITVKNAIVKGIMGNAELSFNSSTTNIPTPHLWLSGQYGKLSVSAYGGGNLASNGINKTLTKTDTKYTETGNELIEENSSRGRGINGYWGIESSLDLNKHNLLTLEAGGFMSTSKSISHGTSEMLNSTGEHIYKYSQTDRNHPSSSVDFNLGVNYQHTTDREGESITVSYRAWGNNNRTHSETEYFSEEALPMDYTGIDNHARTAGTEHTVQIDWTRPLGELHWLDLGGKYIYRNNGSKTTREYIGSDTDHTDFKHNMQIGAIYSDYRFNYGWFGARGGVRYEYTHMHAEFPDGSNKPFSANLGDIVPNASLMFRVNQSNTLKLIYGSRIKRPGIMYLNPAIDRTPNSTSEGNPDLKSALQHSLSLNYNLSTTKISMNIDASYHFGNNEIIGVKYTEGDHTYSGYSNDGHTRNLHIAEFISWRPTSRTTLTLRANADHITIENPIMGDRVTGWRYSAFTALSQRLPLKIMFETAIGWKGHAPELYRQRRATGMSNLMFGIRANRSFLKDERLTVSVQLINPIRGRHPGEITNSWNNGMRSTMQSRNYRMTSFAMAVGYRFGSFKGGVKKVERGINNDDL